MKRFLILLGLLHAGLALKSQETISALEYFIDDDPGYGAATSVSITSGTSISESLQINTSSLSIGFHTLFIRVQNSAGEWGIPESRLVYVDPSGTGIVNIQSLEYFIDDDPGYGSGTAFSAFTAAQLVSQMESVATSSLSVGFHTLYVRAQAEGGSWGIPEPRLIYVDPSGTGIVNIDQLEYFIDDDPGYGSGTGFTAFSAAQMISEMGTISTSSLSTGFHTLFIRARAEGGSWGIPESRLIYVDPSGIGMVNVESLEYFFDDDPGYGNGTAFTAFTAEEVVSQMESLPTSTLSLGFHRLFIRAKAEGGSWGIPESRLVYVDQSGLGPAIVDKLEYFIGDDPGFGNGTDIPVTSGVSIDEMFTVLSTSLEIGENHITIRARDENGRWGIGETRTFTNYAPSRELDSVSLIAIYDETAGASWTNNANWLSTDIDNWFGVTVSGDRVTELDLNNNNLVGVLPEAFGFLEEAISYDLSSNQLSDSVPSSIDLLINLDQLTLDDNNLSDFPNVTLASLNTLNLDSNAFEFGALEPFASVSSFTYDNQATLSTDLDTLVNVGDTFDHTFDVSGSNNVYRWTLNGSAISGATANSLNLSINPVDTGAYILEVTNTALPDLTLRSGVLNYSIPILQADSMLLVALYDQTDGANWTDNTGWLSDNLSNWTGVTLVSDRVSQVDLASNALQGEAPNDLLYLEELTQMNLSGNSLTAIPDLSSIAGLTGFDVSSNLLEFDDLEPNASVSGLVYSPQAELTSDRDTLHKVDEALTFNITTGGSNTYQWNKDNTAIAGETNASLTFAAANFEDEGTYRLDVTNSSLPDLTLSTGDINLSIDAIERDSTALVNLYNALDGTNWPKQENWLSGTLDTWQGVVIGEDKVVGLYLSDNNLSGEVPSDLLDIDQLDSLDLSGNALTGLPVLASLTLASKINLSENRLDFGDLEGNESIETLLTYAPQANLTEDSELLVEIGEQAVFTVTEASTGASYQWQKDDVDLAGQNGLSLTIDDTQVEAEGIYTLGASHPDFPDLMLSSGKFQLKVSSLQRDRIALLNIYDATGGPNWASDAKSWPDQEIETWIGVRIENNRVVEIDLNNEGMIGELPSDINDIRNLELVNLANNKLTGIPTIEGLDQLTSFNVSDNFLDFGDLEPNTEVTGISYAPQQLFGSTESILSPKGTNVLLDRSVEGSANVYAWTVNGPVASGTIEDATIGTLTVTDIDYSNMGTYQVAVTNENVADLTLQSQPFDVLATVDISLLPLYRDIDDELTILDEGDAQLHRVTGLGGFDSLSTVALAGDVVLFDEVVLDNYLISINTDTLLIRQKDTRTDSVRVLPSYYRSTFLWEEADTIFLRDGLEDTLFLQQRPRVALDGDGEVGLLVESDFLENGGKEAQRIEARRKVKRAGCSLRRRRRASGGRPENEDEFELVAYKETDDNGRVTFENLPPDTYRLNIEYPGIPMDPNTFIEFEVGANGMEDNVLELEATITEEGIAVELVEELGFLRNYFKNLSIYPNPVASELNISYEKLMSKHVSVQLLNLQGQLMLERKVQQGLEQRMQLDMSNFDTGVYLLRFIDRSYKIPSIVTYRVMKQ